MKIENILEEFKRICDLTGIHPSEDCLFENAIKIYISNKIGENKRENIESMKDIRNTIKPSVMSSNEEKATEKQVLALIKMGFKGDIEKVTKKEAWKIINEKGGKTNETQRFKKQEDY